MKEFFSELRERGFISQQTHETPETVFDGSQVVGYVGFDPTAESLQVGNLVPIMGLYHLQRSGGKPIVVVGGATGLIGDPAGKDRARPVLSEEAIERNLEAQKEQFKRFLHFGPGREDAVMVNNADWFRDKKYIDFLREVGTHFSVNRMMTMESVANRLEKGLSYLEFNYMVLQAYDFLVLYNRFGCRLQMGGDDQWGNIIMGRELVRRIEGGEACGITFPLLTTPSGQKMGKTEKGTVWLDAKRTPPYDFYQYWINIEDPLVGRCLDFYTLLPLEERKQLSGLKDEEIREAKEVLAFEVTKLVHGRKAAEAARSSSKAAFGSKGARREEGLDYEAIPGTFVSCAELDRGIPVLELLVKCGLTKSNNEGRKLAAGGGLYINEKRFSDVTQPVTKEWVNREGFILLRKGKKTYHRVCVE